MSGDGTSDKIVSEYGSENVFRFNFEMWKAYEVSYSPDYWSITNPVGHTITSESATVAFWWKTFTAAPPLDKHTLAEIKYFLKDLYGWFISRGLAKGNAPDFHNKFGKLNILSFAKEYFAIPPTLFSIGLKPSVELEGKKLITKSLASVLTEENNLLVTTAIPSIESLDPEFPWLLQEEIDSDWDVTIFQCGERLFPFKRSRSELKGLDWRTEQTFFYEKQEWFPLDLESDQEANLLGLSSDLGIEFGRYDFMIDKASGELVFLELNATGQWVFLDIENKYGLLSHVVEWLRPGKG